VRIAISYVFFALSALPFALSALPSLCSLCLLYRSLCSRCWMFFASSAASVAVKFAAFAGRRV
jgi:hypothetical protein